MTKNSDMIFHSTLANYCSFYLILRGKNLSTPEYKVPPHLLMVGTKTISKGKPLVLRHISPIPIVIPSAYRIFSQGYEPDGNIEIGHVSLFYSLFGPATITDEKLVINN